MTGIWWRAWVRKRYCHFSFHFLRLLYLVLLRISHLFNIDYLFVALFPWNCLVKVIFFSVLGVHLRYTESFLPIYYPFLVSSLLFWLLQISIICAILLVLLISRGRFLSSFCRFCNFTYVLIRIWCLDRGWWWCEISAPSCSLACW